MFQGRTNRLARGLAAVAALAVAAGLTVTAGPADRAEAAARMPVDIRVATYNFTNVSLDKKDGEFRPWRERRDAIARQIVSRNIDVIGVQELNPSRVFAPRLVSGKTQFQDLKNGLAAADGYYALTNAKSYNCKKARTAYKCKPKYRGSSHSDRIFYNKRTLSLVSQGAMKYKAQKSKTSPAHMGWAVLSSLATGSQFLFVTTHLEPKVESIRGAQWDELITKVNSIRGNLPVVVTGDFNTHKMSDQGARYMTAMRNNGYGDALGQQPKVAKLKHPRAQLVINAWISSVNKLQRDVRRFSYWDHRDRAGQSIDWIFASNELPVLEYETVVDYDPGSWQISGVIPSNHNMVRATLRLP